MFIFAFFCVRWLHRASSSPTNNLPQQDSVDQAAGLELAPPSVFYGQNFIEVCRVGSGIASSASRYYRNGHFCDQFFINFNDTECVYDREPERSRVSS